MISLLGNFQKNSESIYNSKKKVIFNQITYVTKSFIFSIYFVLILLI